MSGEHTEQPKSQYDLKLDILLMFSIVYSIMG